MANDTVPMSLMFRSCYEVLCRELVPMHYTRLTELALDNLGLAKKKVNWSRQIEDVREKMLIAGQYESFYIGKPLGLGGLKWWFDGDQMRLLKPTEGVLIPGHVRRSIDGAFEALMRRKYMIQKTPATLEKRLKGLARGLILEAHVSGWFREKWPEFYKPPDNVRKWEEACDHDFKLCVDGQTLKIDISGPRRDGTFGNPGGGKRKADFHLLCRIVGPNIRWESIVYGEDFDKTIVPDFVGVCPEHMVVWLNCKRDELDYDAVITRLHARETFVKYSL